MLASDMVSFTVKTLVHGLKVGATPRLGSGRSVSRSRGDLTADRMVP